MILPADMDGEPDDIALSDDLAMLVRQAFPTLSLRNRRLEQSGGDHVLLIIDDHLAFRFPRHGQHDLHLEIAVLQRLQHHSPIATPDYRYVDPAGRFAGYPLIAGSALTPARFAALPGTQQLDVLRTAAGFLAAMHGLPAAMIEPIGLWPVTETPASYADHGLARNLPTIARLAPHHARSIKSFYRRYRTATPFPTVVVHGDLVGEHILLDEHTGQLCGIIDFSDVALGDPAQDFLGFWEYGADAISQLVALLPFAQADPGLLARSRDHFIRYRLDRICEGMRDDDLDPDTAAVQIAALQLV